MTTFAAAPKGHFLFGHAREMNRDTLGFLLNTLELGDLVQIKYGPFPLYIVNHPDLLHEVLVTHHEHYQKSDTTKRDLYPVVGEGLFTSEGELWKRQRKLAQPAFHTKRIAGYAEIMVNYTQRLIDEWQNDTVIDVEGSMAKLTMQIISKSVFDAEVTGTDALSHAVTYVLETTDRRFNRIVSLPSWIPTTENRSFDTHLKHLNQVIQHFIDERRRTGEDKGDLLSMFLMAQDDQNSSMSDKQLRDEAMTVFGAGHETTAATLTWVWYLLSKHPEIAAKLHEELSTALGGKTPTFNDLPNLKYTEMVIKEAMRLYPPAWGASRNLMVDTTLGGHALKRGNVLLLNFYGVHRHPKFWDQPDRFIPERFSPENEGKIHKYAYLPFGGGPRICIGNAFAMMEARLILATIAQRFTLHLAPEETVLPSRRFTLRPKDGLKMTAVARETVFA
ncbi:MAG: cytochrome P450 [Anaerolineae bacterium]|jgi:cytochrome P450|nr:cytochrome P450 [Anaerolineae bacterium]